MTNLKHCKVLLKRVNGHRCFKESTYDDFKLRDKLS